MTTYDKFCPGEKCKRRDECAMHQFSNICTNFPSLRDLSQEWFGEYECGDNGNYQYFIPKETECNAANKQIVEDFLHFLDTKSGVINTDNYTYTYQELRNALIEYHKETAAAAFQSPVISDPDVVSKIKEQMAIYPDEDVKNAKQKLIESFSKMEKHPPFMVYLDKNTEDDIPVISKEQIDEFKEETHHYQIIRGEGIDN